MVDYLNLPAVTAGLGHIGRVGLDAIHRRADCLTGWLLDALAGLRHEGGRRLVQIHGPGGTVERGGTVTFSMQDRDGRRIDDLRVEELANRDAISLRTGCFCNPADAYRFACFLQGFVDRSVAEINQPAFHAGPRHAAGPPAA